MEFAQAQAIANSAVNQKLARTLTEVEIALLFGACNNLTYEEIADRSGYSINYLQRDIGPKFWKLLSDIFGRKVNKTNLRGILSQFTPPITDSQPQIPRCVDWGEAIDVSHFCAREAEIENLSQWIIAERCRLIALVGMGGMGKSALAAKISQLVQTDFEFVIWRSLRNAPPLETLLAELVAFLSQQQDSQGKSERLLHWLRTHRCLVILDNQETILQPGDRAGYYQPDFQNYSDLLRSLGESSHQSCILLTSREKSAEIAILEDWNGGVRSLSLKGSWASSLKLIDSKQLVGSEAQKRQLCEFYSCNPLAVKMIAASIQSLFAGEINAFLQTETLVFNGIRRLLEQQFERLSSLEQTIMYWLAINREWTAIAQLEADIVPAVSRASLLESLESLTWRSFIERRSGEYTQQPVIMEYVTDCLIRQLVSELLILKTSFFNHYLILKTTVLDYIRESQIRLIINPIIEKLKAAFQHNFAQLEQHLKSVLLALRNDPESTFGYGVGNFINLCLRLKIDLTGYDFSHLKIRHADFRGVRLKDVNFQFAHFAQSTFTQLFAGGVSAKFSPDGQQFAVGDTKGELHILQVEGMQPLISIQVHQGWIMGADWHPDGTMLASGVDGVVSLWDARTGQKLRDLHGYNSSILALAWSPDGKYVACGGQQSLLVVWNAITGEHLTELGSNSGDRSCWIMSLAWLADGAVLAGGYTDSTIKFWDVVTGECIRVISDRENWVFSVAMHPNGKIIASSGYDKTVKLWNWQTGECLQAVNTQEPFYQLMWSPDGERLAGGSMNGCVVNLWDCSLQCLKVLQGHENWVWSVSWSPDGSILASTSFDQVVKLWNTQTWQCVKTLRGYSNSSWCVRWSNDGIRLLTASTNHTVQLWDGQTGECLRVFCGHSNEVMFVAWSPDERLMASGSGDTTVRIWDVQTGECLQVLQGHQSWVRGVTWCRDENCLISCASDGAVKLWDTHSGQCLLTLSGHSSLVNSVAWCSVGNQVASGGLDGTVRFWDLSRGVCSRVISVGRFIGSVAFSPDGKTLASGDYDGVVQLWDVASGECLKTFLGHTNGRIYSVDWSADSNKIASTCTDKTVRIWNVDTGDCEQIIQGKNHGMSVHWHPVKDLLAIAFLEQPIQIYDLQIGETVQTLSRYLPYEGVNINGVKGISEGQKMNLKALGAI
ncbi:MULTISPECIES: WD40 domain-containing protein [Calothrix]|uniref:NACHT domain-containing protein n=2 Tax=Calothrix TaxID=1186 RepID=A0ABR8A4V6_9CYAN|nr:MULTISPECIES: NB-ARC domain-containing protein [Calothrix]MBD2194818.1 NACHT domain-containing protein [Calothrix parietina FACHB-288]MBD2228818.1 NACHT domain-containing protein [Calothrix anomala FACHB-343]